MDTETQDILVIARSYCHLIEHCEQDNEVWLSRIAALLPQLHAAIFRASADGRIEWDEGIEEESDLEDRFALYAQLKGLLGENDSYWLEYDGSADSQLMTGSLADDLTDIYCELKQGLENLKQASEPSSRQVLRGWRQGYRMHWGQHLLDAERHLYSLEVAGRL
jgi:hypothetical protein